MGCQVAQSVERRTLDVDIQGSKPSLVVESDLT